MLIHTEFYRAAVIFRGIVARHKPAKRGKAVSIFELRQVDRCLGFVVINRYNYIFQCFIRHCERRGYILFKYRVKRYIAIRRDRTYISLGVRVCVPAYKFPAFFCRFAEVSG